MFKKLCVLALCAVLASCSASGNKKVLNSSSIANVSIDQVDIDYSNTKEVNVDLESLGYDGNGLALSIQQAQQSAAQSAGGAGGPAAGFAGAVLGVTIAQNMAVSSAIREKNSRVPQLIAKMRALDYPAMWQGSQFKISGKAAASQDLAMTLKPKVSVTADYQSFLIMVEVTVKQRGSLKYQNYFYLQSQPITDAKEGLPALEKKSPEWIAEQLQATMKDLPKIIELDISKGQQVSPPSAIRFSNSMGRFYERGSILAQHQTHLTFKTLRGEVKHLPFERLL